ncbi:MAG: hypothetical protein V1834_04410 [Candidatus Micrarchaeota archaeon]
MGFFSLGSESKPAGKNGFVLECAVHPLRLPANKADFVELEIVLESQSNDSQLASLLIDLPKSLGFDQSALSQRKEIRFGELMPGQKKKLTLNIYGTQRTQPGSYNIYLTASSHYRTYEHVLAEVRKTIVLRAA